MAVSKLGVLVLGSYHSGSILRPLIFGFELLGWYDLVVPYAVALDWGSLKRSPAVLKRGFGVDIRPL